jgi:lactonase
VRLDQEGRNPTVLYDKLAGANGIAFSPDYSNLWLSEYRRSIINHIVLSDEGSKVADVTVGMYVGSGKGLADSITAGFSGKCVSVWDAGRVMIYSPHGDLVGIVETKANFPKPQRLSTNVAIKTGSTDAYLMVGGENGGYVYHFEALAPGGAQLIGG